MFQKIAIISAMLCVSSFVIADTASCGVPLDNDGDTIPTLNGNIPFLKMPDALCAGNNEFTWDYSGTLENENQRFSFQSSLGQLLRNGGSLGLGMQEFYFGFQDPNAYFYSNSTYGGKDKEAIAIAQTLNIITSSASLEQLSVASSLIADPHSTWTIRSYEKPIAQLPIFKGFVGQPGHQYQLTGNGNTFLWRYDKKTGQSSAAPYQYHFNLIMLDERGATMEGVGGGYVGPQLIPHPSTTDKIYNVESEIAQPRLKVMSWQVTMQATDTTINGFQSSYSFSGNQGMLWNDFGPLVSVHLPENKREELFNTQKSINVSALSRVVAEVSEKSLYNGSWIPIQFTSGKYAGAALAVSAFWNKSERYPKDQTTNNKEWAIFGWINYFSGFIPGRVDSVDSTFETLYPENPALPASENTHTPPYEIRFEQFAPDRFNLKFPWVQKLTVIIKANTKLRYMLASYANTLANDNATMTADDPNADLRIEISAINPVTQNTLFSDEVSQFYEGAAIPTINDKVVGYAWIEHMIK